MAWWFPLIRAPQGEVTLVFFQRYIIYCNSHIRMKKAFDSDICSFIISPLIYVSYKSTLFSASFFIYLFCQTNIYNISLIELILGQLGDIDTSSDI